MWGPVYEISNRNKCRAVNGLYLNGKLSSRPTVHVHTPHFRIQKKYFKLQSQRRISKGDFYDNRRSLRRKIKRKKKDNHTSWLLDISFPKKMQAFFYGYILRLFILMLPYSFYCFLPVSLLYFFPENIIIYGSFKLKFRL